MLINWRWPNTKEQDDLCPLYIIVWRLPWYLIMLLGRFIFSLGVWGCYLSWSSCLEAWENSQ